MFAALNAFLTRAVSGYFLNKSLRFRASASAYLNRTFAAGNQKTWTWSGWVKRGTLSNYPVLFSIGSGSLSSNYGAFRFNDGTNKFEIFDATNNMGVSSIVWESTAVYRDPAAWYHIVVVLDTTQASAVNRFSLYVNGIIQVGSFTVTPAQNANCLFNQAANHTIGIFAGNYASTSKFDGEMAEINFVDGQALAPTSFGAYSTYNQWLPIRYAGTYGTNGFYLPFSGGTATSYAGSFNGSTQLLSIADNAALEPGSSNLTVECWVYPTASGAVSGSGIFSKSALGAFAPFNFQQNPSNNLVLLLSNAGTGWDLIITSASTLLLNTWTHVCFTRSANTFTLYINGVSNGSGTLAGSLWNNTESVMIANGNSSPVSNTAFKGYISNLRYVIGTAVYTANFIPPTAALTAVTNTSLLTLQNATIVDNSTNAFTITNTGTVVTSVQSPFLNTTVLTADSSGNANNWTPNNISLTAGSTYDSLLDSPVPSSATVGNYAVMNPLFFNGNQCTLSDGNLTIYKAGASYGSQLSTIGFPTTGKFYFETTIVSNSATNNQAMGIASSTATYVFALDCFYTGSLIRKFVDGSVTTGYGSASNGMVIGVAVDATNGKAYIAINNTWIDSSSPTGGTNGYSMTSGVQYFGWFQGYNSGASAYNFGQQPFTYTAPTGFLPLNTFSI